MIMTEERIQQIIAFALYKLQSELFDQGVPYREFDKALKEVIHTGIQSISDMIKDHEDIQKAIG